MSSFLPPQTYGGGTVLQNQPSSEGVPYYLERPTGTQAGPGQGISTLGLVAQGVSAFTSAIGGYYSTISQRQAGESQALSLENQRFMSQQNARSAEELAQQILQQGRYEVARLTLQAGQEKSRKKVSAAARGVDITVGSASEVLATEDIVKEMDATTIGKNSARAAGQARLQRVNASNQSLLAGVSAGNLRRTARSMSPGIAAASNGLAGLGAFAQSFARRI